MFEKLKKIENLSDYLNQPYGTSIDLSKSIDYIWKWFNMVQIWKINFQMYDKSILFFKARNSDIFSTKWTMHASEFWRLFWALFYQYILHAYTSINKDQCKSS